MAGWIDTLMALLALTNLAYLATANVLSLIRVATLQGILLGSMPLFYGALLGRTETSTIVFSLVAIAVKGVGFPLLLLRTFRRVQAKREVEPYIGYSLSVLAGVVVLVISFWLAGRLQLPGTPPSAIALPVAFMTILTGFMLIITRKKAITQVIGYLAAENGIYLFGATVSPHGPVWIELSILLDVFVAVFVMGIAIHNISRQFDSVDTNLFETIKD